MKARSLRSLLLVTTLGAAAACGGTAAVSGATASPTPTAKPSPSPSSTATPLTGPAPCDLPANPALMLLYTGVGGQKSYDFLKACAGEVVIGEKHVDHPTGVMKTAEAHAAGGRTAYIIASNGREIRDKLLRTDGVAKTKAEFQAMLDAGYDYIVVDEITADPMWADGATVNVRFRQLIDQMPARTFIAYISIDLTQQAGGQARLTARRLLLRKLKQRGRALALEVYLHTDAVIAGQSTGVIRTAANRVANAVANLSGGVGINKKCITVMGTTIRGTYAQYRYLDHPSRDLSSVAKQAYATRHASARVMQQRGLGFYFVGASDLEPLSGAPYTKDQLIARMVLEAKRARRL